MNKPSAIATGDKLNTGTIQTAQVPNGQNGIIVILGASYVKAWPVDSVAGMQVVNKGINGEQSFEMLERFREDVLAFKPTAVIIWGFINDIHRNQRDRIEATMARVKESTAAMTHNRVRQRGGTFEANHSIARHVNTAIILTLEGRDYGIERCCSIEERPLSVQMDGSRRREKVPRR